LIQLKVTTRAGKELVILGITAENWRALREGNPIHVDGDTLGLNHDIAILGAPTAQDMVDLLLQGKVISIAQAATMRRYFTDED
jgi:hypothetical protein